jgi:leucyl/phenylalanyl-tRNA--protein transferase
MYFLSDKIWFPPVEEANPDGLLAIGGDLSPERLKLAYRSGIFPWFSKGDPIIWYSPDPRMVLFPEKLKISKSMRQLIRKGEFTITFNTDFKNVIANCKIIERPGQPGTWITDEMQSAYLKLHELNLAKSVEVWQNNDLIGGLYGIDLGHTFSGESMFSKVSNASKLAFIYLVEKMEKEQYKILDCQLYNEHLASLGAEEISRKEFLNYI